MIPGSVVISIEISRVTRMCDLPDGSNKDHPTTQHAAHSEAAVSFVEFCEHLGKGQDNRAERAVKQNALYSGRVELLSSFFRRDKNDIKKTLGFSTHENQTG